MGLRMKTLEILSDTKTCERIMKMLEVGISKKYIRNTFNISERELQRIIQFYSDSMEKVFFI